MLPPPGNRRDTKYKQPTAHQGHHLDRGQLLIVHITLLGVNYNCDEGCNASKL